MFQIERHFPVQGSNKFETVSFTITKAVAVDFGAMTTGTGTRALFSLPKGTLVLGSVVRIKELLVSTAAATVQFGFTAQKVLTTATGSGVAVVGAILPAMQLTFTSDTAVSAAAPYTLEAADTFDIILAVDKPSAGKADIFLTYVPVPTGDIDTANFLSIITT